MPSESKTLRVGLLGASGTGKSTLMEALSERIGLTVCPVGSRTVTAEMGFTNPYDVDMAGVRAEFQQRLLDQKSRWERKVVESERGFISDRTHLDNMAYTQMHMPTLAASPEFDAQVTEAMRVYTHLIFCPISAMHNLAGDPARVVDRHYHNMYEARLMGLLFNKVKRAPVLWLTTDALQLRIEQAASFVLWS